MEQTKLPTPQKRLHKLLIWAYKPQSHSKEALGAVKRVGGRSPLDIPGKTVFFSLIAALAAIVVIGNIVFWTIHIFIGVDLGIIEENQDSFKLENNGALSNAVASALVPQLQSKIQEADEAIIKRLEASFPEKKITVKALALFMEKDEREIRAKIIGKLSYLPLIILPSFSPQPPDEIADDYGFNKSYRAVSGEIDSITWNRYIVISGIQYIRDRLDNGVHHPRRLLFSLSGIIQWLTFLAATWCLILLLVFRIPWANLQMFLATENHLPWHSDKLDVWDIRSSYFADLDEKVNHPGMLVGVRLIKDVLNVTKSDKSASIYHIVRERIEAYRNSVEIGEYEIINFLIWATPTFGFLGTIFGIISAMENAAAIFAAPSAIEQGIALDKVSVALGVAFDTSFIALVWLIPMSYFLARTRKAEANLFEELEFEAIANIPPQIREKG